MPKKAYMWNKNGNAIDANEVQIKYGKAIFLCCTNGCDARMVLCKAGTEDAYFRSKNRGDHNSVNCIRNSIVFKADTYDESLFDLNFAFESMLGINSTIKSIDRGDTGTRQGNVGNHRRLRIHTLLTLYAMCISKAKNERYNGILIDDIFADEENYGRYFGGIQGYKVVETSFYFYTDSDMSITLNYPSDYKGKSSWVKIIFEDRTLYERQKARFYKSLHIEPIIIAGKWELAPIGSKHHSECKIHKASQICYVKMR